MRPNVLAIYVVFARKEMMGKRDLPTVSIVDQASAMVRLILLVSLELCAWAPGSRRRKKRLRKPGQRFGANIG